MRPGVDVSGGRARKELDPASSTPLGHGTPISFRMATEEELQGSTSVPLKQVDDSTYGVRSLQDTIYDGTSLYKNKREDSDTQDDEEINQSGRRYPTLRPKPKHQTRDSSRENVGLSQPATGDSSPSHPIQEGPSPPSMSHSLASLSLDSQAPLSSLPSSPKSTSNRSFRPSDEDSVDDGGSQAIASSEDDDVEPHSEIRDSAPQLIMPSIKMPSRRPFTERGRRMGRLKVLIAGDSGMESDVQSVTKRDDSANLPDQGVGKSSLIKSIVQTCEDIVHVDPLSSNPPSIELLPGQKTSKQDSRSNRSTQQITEVFASTKPYPTWWSDIEDTKVLRRRKSLGDTVLERNLCFVDTPGYNNGISKMETIQSVLQYIEVQLSKPFSALTASEGDIAGLLSGGGGTQVDLVFYLIAKELKDEDILYLQRLAIITNVVPVIAKADTLSPEEIEMLRRSIDKLQQAEIRCFSFSNDRSAVQSSFTICSAPSDDNDNMDASILMSPDYVQPLIPSELATLVERVFDPENIACLRHLAAKKLVHAHGSTIFSIPATISKGLSNGPGSPTSKSPSSTSQTIISYPLGISTYKQALIADHTQQEEKLAQIRLAKWAGELQKSLQNERARYEAIARGERAVWLTEKLDECVKDGALVSIESRRAMNEKGPPKAELLKASSHRGLLDPSDPLGLLRWNEAMKRRGWIAFQVVGSFGILGAMAVWMARTWGAGSDGYNWPWQWLGGRV